MTCCGKDRRTPFCPICGKAMAGSALATLLAHCRSQVESHRKAVEKNGEYEQMHHSAKRSVEKWQAWADALAAIMAGADESQTEGR